ncbi:MAG: type I DNA topoisomerase [Elusimicrobiales bacterium]
MKDLVIVESPTKQKTISKFLGNNFVVKSSYGHIRDLPEDDFGVDIENGFKPHYILIDRAKKVIAELMKFASSSRNIYLATDPDREGEAISWHITEALKNIDRKKFRRITFHEITKEAIIEALKNPRDIDINLVNAQQARRILDRIVGYKISPLLWKKIKGGLSAGRVQSVAVRLVYERDKEISTFEVRDYFTINGLFAYSDSKIQARMIKWNGQNVERYTVLKLFAEDYKYRSSIFEKKEDAFLAINLIRDKKFNVIKKESKTVVSKPKPPFITSTLQQEAYTRLGFTSDRTMKIAQKLYEGVSIKGEMRGLITYMRTDSFNVSKNIQLQAQKFIKENYGDDYCPQTPPVYIKKVKGAQEAHEAIHPTDVFLTPESVKGYLSDDEFKLYDLIWKKFMASQMENAVFEQLTIEISDEDNRSVFKAGGRSLKFDGYLKVYGDDEEDKDNEENAVLPPISQGDMLLPVDFDVKSHTTTPPPSYNEASLIKTLEIHGIGRPSTYATIISNIIHRGYIKRDKSKKLIITELGRKVTEKLIEFFPDIMSLNYTADIEDKLDDIASGSLLWTELLLSFYNKFKIELDKANKEMSKEGAQIYYAEKCPVCGADMILRESRFGKFLTCSKFPRCKGKIGLSDNMEKKFIGVKTTERCSVCKTGYMVLRKGSKGYFLGCSNFPKCKNVKKISDEEVSRILSNK